MSRDASKLAPPGYFENAKRERRLAAMKEAELTPEALLTRIQNLEAKLDQLAEPITHPGEIFPRI